MKKLILGSLILLATIILFLAYSGLFTSIKIEEKDMGPFTLAYEEHTGDYGKTGDIIERVRGTLEKEFNLKPEKGFGIYYDDPKKVPAEKLRSEAGFIIAETDGPRLKAVQSKLKVKTYEKTKSVVAEFPFRNTLSMLIGLMRVYPVMDRYMKEKGYSPGHSMEIYSMSEKKTVYLFPVKK